jgi:hypothetical protein
MKTCIECNCECELIKEEEDLCCECFDSSMMDQDTKDCCTCQARIKRRKKFNRRKMKLTDFVKQ